MSKRKYKIVSISANGKERTDGRYPLRIGRICREPNPVKGEPLFIEYLKNADGSEYRGVLITSIVCGSWINEKDNLCVMTMNSIYEFQEITEEGAE